MKKKNAVPEPHKETEEGSQKHSPYTNKANAIIKMKRENSTEMGDHQSIERRGQAICTQASTSENCFSFPGNISVNAKIVKFP